MPTFTDKNGASVVCTADLEATFAQATTAGLPVYTWAQGYQWYVEFGHGHVGDQPEIVAAPDPGWSGSDVTLNSWTERNGLQPIEA